MALAAAAAVIAVVAVNWWHSERFFYRHQVELWPNPDPIDGSSWNLHYPIEFAPDGSVAIAKDHRDRILILDPPTGRIARIVSDGGDQLVNSMAFAKDGKSIVSAGSAGQVNVWDASTGFLLRTFRLSERTPVVERRGNVTKRPIPATTFSFHGTVQRCCAKTPTKSSSKSGTSQPDAPISHWPGSRIKTCSPSHARNLIALCDSSHKVSLRDIRKPASRPLFDATPNWNVHACFSPDESIVATTCSQEIQLWNTRTGTRLRVVSFRKQVPLDADVTELAFSSNGTTLAVGAEWRVDTWQNLVLGKSDLSRNPAVA